MANEESVRPVGEFPWLESVLSASVSFSVLTLSVGCWHLACKKPESLIPKGRFQNK